jgi:hypothetical protein
MPSNHEIAKSLMEIIELLEPLREMSYPATTPAGAAYFKLGALYRLILLGDVADED